MRKIGKLTRQKPASSLMKSGIKGVTWCRINCKWRARIYANGVHRSLGYFISRDDAVRALRDVGDNLAKWQEGLDNQAGMSKWGEPKRQETRPQTGSDRYVPGE
jgi:hypothetical protein